MSEEQLPEDPQIQLIKRLVDSFAYEMNNKMHDGYVNHGYRVILLELRDYINEKLGK